MDNDDPIPEPQHFLFAPWRWSLRIWIAVLLLLFYGWGVVVIATVLSAPRWLNDWLGFDMEFGP